MSLLFDFRLFDVNSPISLKNKLYLLDNFCIDAEGYDVIIGYRTDDSYFSFIIHYSSTTC